MKGILIAAGLGTRLGPHTAAMPKCLLPVGSKTMLEHQIHAFRASGIEDIVVINGHQAERFPELGVTYVHNGRYRDNNILNSLMCAAEHMAGGFLCSYSDLVYEPAMVGRLLEAPGEIVLSVDDTWKSRYAHLAFHPPQAVEKVAYDREMRVSDIGKGISNDAPGEFIGLVRCTAPAAQRFVAAFAQAKQQFWGQPFVRALDFEKAYLTDFLQYLIDGGTEMHGVVASDITWVEVDTEEDLQLANATFTPPN
jgi:choline kinase